MRNYSGFYQGLSGYYMVFMNYIVALRGKIILLQFLSDCGVKTRSSRVKLLHENFYPSPTLSYTITKKSKRGFCGAKVIGDPETPEGPE